jgi:hypothetical protein
MKIKYVIFDVNQPVLVGDYAQHSDVRLKYRGEPTSAGFCAFSWNEEKCDWDVNVWGESVSLNLKSHPDDAKAIARLLKPGF